MPTDVVQDVRAKKMQEKVETLAMNWVTKKGNSITSDELREFFWSTFIALKNIQTASELNS